MVKYWRGEYWILKHHDKQVYNALRQHPLKQHFAVLAALTNATMIVCHHLGKVTILHVEYFELRKIFEHLSDCEKVFVPLPNARDTYNTTVISATNHAIPDTLLQTALGYHNISNCEKFSSVCPIVKRCLCLCPTQAWFNDRKKHKYKDSDSGRQKISYV
uniref:Uncharacterized protein n=1 Tax=Romanomermis culicivorax TaxID=13658 RepID=A0A915IDS5_ROMCU